LIETYIQLVFRTSVSGFNRNLDLPEFLEGWKDGRMEGRDGKIPVFSKLFLRSAECEFD